MADADHEDAQGGIFNRDHDAEIADPVTPEAQRADERLAGTARIDADHGTTLASQRPILCAECHASPALGQLTRKGGVPFLSEAVHSFHAGVPSPPGCCHGGIRCAGCHGSPHAMVPTRVASDQAQALQYQGAAKALGSCGVCHGTSRGGGSEEFGEKYGAGGETPSACAVCHTGVSATTARWPHAVQWKAR